MSGEIVPLFHCGFCLKKRSDVQVLITGPMQIAICNECVETCVEIVNEDRQKAGYPAFYVRPDRVLDFEAVEKRCAAAEARVNDLEQLPLLPKKKGRKK